MVKRIKTFFNVHGYQKACNIETTANFNYVTNQSPTFSNNLFFAVCCEEINVDKALFNLLETALGKIFVSTFNKEIGLQFFMTCLSRSFFSMSLMTACLCEMLKIFVCKA